MGLIRNILALIGLLSVIGLVYALVVFMPYYDKAKAFDKKALATYTEMATRLLETGNAAEATVWKARVKDGVSADDVETTIRSVANEHNIKNVGELPLYKQVTAMTGKPYRYLKIYMLCDPLTAAKMADYSDAFTAYLPCRLTSVQDKSGQLWIYTLNMDMMIHGGTPLPEDLRKEAEKVKFIISDIMKRAASGEF